MAFSWTAGMVDLEQPLLRDASERTLTLCPLIALIFFEVSGGPFGVEDAVGAAGPFWALLGFVIFPLVWSVPEALVTAELTGRFPENAGYVAWVTEAFGPAFGFVEGWCSWWSGAIDNGIYPGLFLQYLRQASGGPGGWLDNREHHFVALLAINAFLTYVSWRGLDFVGRAAIVLGVVAVSPFLAMTVLAVPHLDLMRLSSRKACPNWRLLLNTLMWNLNCKSTSFGSATNSAIESHCCAHPMWLRDSNRRLGLGVDAVWRSSAPEVDDSSSSGSDRCYSHSDIYGADRGWMRKHREYRR